MPDTSDSSGGAFLEARHKDAPPMRLPLPGGRPVILGRSKAADLSLSIEPFLGRRHVSLRLDNGRLQAERIADSANPVFVAGEPKDSFQLMPGESFVIGSTVFRFSSGEASRVSVAESLASPQAQRTLHERELFAMGESSDRMRLRDLLELPEVLRSTKEPRALYLHAAGLLRLATGAKWACVLDGEGTVLAQDTADDAAKASVSKTLLAKAVAEIPRPTVWRWSKAAGPAGATETEGVEWAVCAATRLADGAVLSFYAAGGGLRAEVSDKALDEHARFVGLVADMVGRTLSTDRLQTLEKRLERFFSAPIAAKILESGSAEGLEPRLAQGTVLFFDLRGFSRKTEGSNEELLKYMAELRGVMTEMTGIVLDEQGAVLQYIGDAIMACWNLPVADERHVDRACRAALRMSQSLARMSGGWRCGIGIHTGEVVAGAIGSEQVFAYGVLGAVVNQASRVEGITKIVETTVLVTRAVAERLTAGVAAPRRLGRFRPAGMSATLELFELRPPDADRALDARFEDGVSRFERGDWGGAYEAFDGVPSADLPARFLKSLAEQNRRSPPKAWEGVVEFDSK